MQPEPLSFDDWWNAHALAASLVPPDSRVLDVGCGWGEVAQRLQAKGCRVTGVEPDPARLRRAAAWCERALEGVAERLDDLGLEKASFDTLVFADVLEHLPDPWSTLRASLAYLKPGGRVVISIPNAANYAARLNLLKGEFRYQEFGLYDRTHLRFFTRATLLEMLSGAGLRVAAWRHTPNLTETGLFRRTLGRLPFLRRPFRVLDRALTHRLPRLLAVQFIVACERTPVALDALRRPDEKEPGAAPPLA